MSKLLQNVLTLVLEVAALAEVDDLVGLLVCVEGDSGQEQLHVVLAVEGTLAEIVHGHLPETPQSQQTNAVLSNEELAQL